LKAKGVSTRNISDALKRIDPEEYRKSVEEIIQKRLEREAKLPEFQRIQKVARYLISRGYDSSTVWKCLNYND
jgi:regulatory protein